MSTKGLNGFLADLTEFGEVIMPREHKALCQRIAMDVVRGIDQKMPVKSGFARGNWQVSNGTPITVPIQRFDKSGNDTVTANLREISKAEPMKKIIWIANNADYITLLEDGSSQQARTGMVENTLDEVVMKVKSGVI